MSNNCVNRWQEVLYDLAYGPDALINPKAVAHRLHRAHNYLSDICRRDRVDPLAVFNEILIQAEPLAAVDQARLLAISQPIFRLLTDSTRWLAVYQMADTPQGAADLSKLCEQAGLLMEVLGGAVQSLAAIERDGKIDRDDDAEIASFILKAQQLTQRLNAIAMELQRRRHEKVVP